MRAALKRLDVDGEALGRIHPDDPTHFAFGVTASIGPLGEPGEEHFSFTVCSPSWLATQRLPKGFAFQRHTLLVEHWSSDIVEHAISDLCRHTEGEGWAEVATKLSRFGFWEFEDYEPNR